MKANYIVLFDPSLSNHKGDSSINLGDLIIYDSIVKNLNELFPKVEILRISTHSYLEPKHFRIANQAYLSFFGGTNMLSSRVREYNQWKISNNYFSYIFPRIKNVILFGVGWWQYQESPDALTRFFYKNVLSKKHVHSVRDSYTRSKIFNLGMNNVLNTSCPTIWELNGVETNRKNLSINNCLFMLTDYMRDPYLDTTLIEILFKYFTGDILFFPQGSNDVAYINSLEIYKNNHSKITILERNYDDFKRCISNNGICFVGTRLHGGIKCLNYNHDSVIISIDNRATEISKDINLPVVGRGDFDKLSSWLEGKKVFKNIELDLNSIQAWKDQFNVY